MNTTMPEHLILDHMPTPIGNAVLAVDADGCLRAFEWADHDDRMRRSLARHCPDAAVRTGRPPAEVRGRIEAYFDGDLAQLDAIACRTDGTAFQQDVWAALRRIPAGTTLSYGELAAMIGRPAAVRAVGLANGANPIGLVQPCHRVIGADGRLTGYGGGLERKRWLLEHEGVLLPVGSPAAG